MGTVSMLCRWGGGMLGTLELIGLRMLAWGPDGRLWAVSQVTGLQWHGTQQSLSFGCFWDERELEGSWATPESSPVSLCCLCMRSVSELLLFKLNENDTKK